MSTLPFGVTGQCLLDENSMSIRDAIILPRQIGRTVRAPEEDIVEYIESEPGTLEARPIKPDSIPTAGPDDNKVMYKGDWHLCNACLSALGYLVRHEQEVEACKSVHGHDDHEMQIQDPDNPKNHPESAIQLHSLMALDRSASRGCHICTFIAWRCRTDLIRFAESVPLGRESFTELLFQKWNRQSDRQPGSFDLICALSFVRANEPPMAHNYVNLVRFQLWPFPEVDSFIWQQMNAEEVELQELSLSADVPNLRDAFNTKSCRRLALRGMHECVTNKDSKHGACNQTNHGWLPTRVLDLREIGTTGKLYVRATATMTEEGGQYISLSHCWGERGSQILPTLTASNLLAMQDDGLDFEMLPKTFRDAVKIAGWFGVRYIWIDSLCIIQDPSTDFEASKMDEVYRNAFLNISAHAALDARGGCFRFRDVAGVEPFQLAFNAQSEEWLVTLDERNSLDWTTKDPLWKRAWVYQERQLSRRLLHFTSNEVFWECSAEGPYFRSETWPQGPPFGTAFRGNGKISHKILDGNVTAQTIEENLDLSEAWNKICEDVSTKDLSYQSDKFPSLAGLARRFGQLFRGDMYIAGLWRSSLHRTLLWKVKKSSAVTEDYSQEFDDEYVAPSWSWRSAKGAIRMPKLSRGINSLVKIHPVITHLKNSDPFGRLSNASLEVEGFVREVTIKTEICPWDGVLLEMALNFGIPEKVDVFIDDVANAITFRDGGPYTSYVAPDFDPDDGKYPKSRNYTCLLVGVKTGKVREKVERTIHGLLLRPTADKDCFCRAGTISFTDSMSRDFRTLKLRYRLRRGMTGKQTTVKDIGNPEAEISAKLEDGKSEDDGREVNKAATGEYISDHAGKEEANTKSEATDQSQEGEYSARQLDSLGKQLQRICAKSITRDHGSFISIRV